MLKILAAGKHSSIYCIKQEPTQTEKLVVSNPGLNNELGKDLSGKNTLAYSVKGWMVTLPTIAK